MRNLCNLLLVIGLMLGMSSVAMAVEKGDEAPNFDYETMDGKKGSLSNHKGMIILVEFWATW